MVIIAKLRRQYPATTSSLTFKLWQTLHHHPTNHSVALQWWWCSSPPSITKRRPSQQQSGAYTDTNLSVVNSDAITNHQPPSCSRLCSKPSQSSSAASSSVLLPKSNGNAKLKQILEQ
jgi:hypothetical protein